jgi:hypothetical protein
MNIILDERAAGYKVLYFYIYCLYQDYTCFVSVAYNFKLSQFGWNACLYVEVILKDLGS